MNDLQQKKRKLRLIVTCVGLVALLALSIYSAHVILNTPKDYRVTPIVAFGKMPSYKTPVTPTIYTGPGMRRTELFGQKAAPSTMQYRLPSSQMGSTSMRLHETSSATVKTIGGGGGGSGAIALTSSNNSQGINSSIVSYSTAIFIPSVTTAITAVGATEAASLANTVTPEPAGAPDRRRVSGDPHGPFPDPVGAVPFVLMSLMAAMYAVFKRKRTAHKYQ